jgi:hypothetical protein
MKLSKWRSKVTKAECEVRDGWDTQENYSVVLSFTGFENTSSWIRLSYSQFIEAFERAEDNEPVKEGIYDGWDTE